MAGNFTRNNKYNLTRREFEILQMVVRGLNNVEIAREAIISTHTAHAHVSSILCKLNVTNRIKAAVLAVRENLV